MATYQEENNSEDVAGSGYEEDFHSRQSFIVGGLEKSDSESSCDIDNNAETHKDTEGKGSRSIVGRTVLDSDDIEIDVAEPYGSPAEDRNSEKSYSKVHIVRSSF